MTLTLASASRCTLSTNLTMRVVISAPRGPSGARKFWSSGSRLAVEPEALRTAEANASNGTIVSIVV